MTERIVALVAANAMLAVLGAGLLPWLRLAHTRRQLLTRLPLAYAVGIAAGGILVAHLSLLHVPLGRIGLPLLAAVVARARAAAPARRGSRRPRAARGARTSRRSRCSAVAAAFAIPAARLFAVKPLLESDGWVIWATRAGRSSSSAIRPPRCSPTRASRRSSTRCCCRASRRSTFRFMGSFDATLLHLQLLGLGIAFVGGAWVLLREHTPPVLLAATLLAVVTAPTFFRQLQTNFADVPVAMLDRRSASPRSRRGSGPARPACCPRPRSSSARAR